MGPLDGVRVVDLSRVLAGPLCTMYLGDLGADVIKVEAKGRGDDSRAWGPPYHKESGHSTYYLSVNRNKRSIELDLRSQDGHDLAEQLISEADILVENFRPGALTELSFDPDRLHHDYPRLIHCSITGFGPDVDRPGYDLLGQAVSGLMSITGEADGEPTKTGVAIVDVLTGMNATIGILAALHARSETGVGQRVEVDLFQSALTALVNQASAWLNAKVIPGRIGNAHPSVAPYEPLPAADGPIAVAIGNDQQFVTLCELANQHHLAADARFATNAARVNNRHELLEILGPIFRAKTRQAWLHELELAGLPSGPVLDVAEAFAFGKSLGLDATIQQVLTNGGRVRSVASPLTLSRTPVSYRLPPPHLGEHTGDPGLQGGSR